MIEASRITYLEGYLWDPPHAKEAFRKAATIAHGAGRQVALTLSDAFCVAAIAPSSRPDPDRHGRSGVRQRERAAEPLRDRRFRHRVKALRGDARLAAVTRSEKGCVVVSKAARSRCRRRPIKEFVDATGAGDLFAAGFLFGLARGRDHKTRRSLARWRRPR
jgi:adenosine kinase